MIETLEVCWSGTLEHDGLCEGLSRVNGPSTMAALVALGTDLHDIKDLQARARRVRLPGSRFARTRSRHPALDPTRVLALRHAGHSWNAIARIVGGTRGQVRYALGCLGAGEAA